MFVSVILSTYESPDWLAKVVWGYAAQTHRDFELVIADDGSSPRTAECIGYLRHATKLSLRHVWHAKHGFRKCRILNRAILAVAGDYLIRVRVDGAESPLMQGANGTLIAPKVTIA